MYLSLFNDEIAGRIRIAAPLKSPLTTAKFAGILRGIWRVLFFATA